MNDNFDPREASGEAAMRGAQSLLLNEVSLNGDGSAKEVSSGKWERQGGYFRKRILIGNPKGQKPEEVKLGENISVVFLKIRRRLVERGKDGEIVRSTGEHNSKFDAVSVYEGATKTKFNGVASDLREKFEGLRTVQVVYALLCGGTSEPELVRLIVKGASLGSEVRAKEMPNFYEYLQSFSGEEHFYEYKTVLTPVLEEGKQTYFVMKFERSEKLNEKSYAYAMSRMKEVHENCLAVDKQRAQRIAADSTTDTAAISAQQAPEEEAAIDYPKDDINPDDIPF